MVTKTLVVTDEPLTLTLREIFADLTGFLKMVVGAKKGACLLMLQLRCLLADVAALASIKQPSRFIRGKEQKKESPPSPTPESQ